MPPDRHVLHLREPPEGQLGRMVNEASEENMQQEQIGVCLDVA